MDSTGQRIIAAATPRAPPPTPDSNLGSVNGQHWRSDSSWSLGSNSTVASGGDGGEGSVASVKDTHEVVRRKASLPAVSPLGGGPMLGDCSKSRCMVNQYVLLDLLGTGSFGEVRLCMDTGTEELFAMKIVRKEAAIRQTPPVDVVPADPSAPPPLTPRSRCQQQYEQLRSEIAVMKQLSHPHVLRLVEVLDSPKFNKIYLVRFACSVWGVGLCCTIHTRRSKHAHFCHNKPHSGARIHAAGRLATRASWGCQGLDLHAAWRPRDVGHLPTGGVGAALSAQPGA